MFPIISLLLTMATSQRRIEDTPLGRGHPRHCNCRDKVCSTHLGLQNELDNIMPPKRLKKEKGCSTCVVNFSNTGYLKQVKYTGS